MTGELRTLVRTAAETLGVSISENALDRLGNFLVVLAEWSRAIRLVADVDERMIAARHLIDSLAVLPHLSQAGPVVDIGSGAGFPGVVVACVRPGLSVMLVEARRKRANYLRDVVRRVPLPAATVMEVRAEGLRAAVGRTAATTVSRGVNVEEFLEASSRILRPGGRAIAMQSRTQRRDMFDVERVFGGGTFGQPSSVVYRLPDGRIRELAIFECRDMVSPQGGV